MSNLKIYDVRTLPGDSAFLIDDGKTSIMYDSGFAFTGYQVADKIKQILRSRSLDYIFLTHSHYDHALGSVYALEYWPNAKVVAGEYAANIFSKPSAKATMRELDRKFAKKCNVDFYEDLIDNLRVDIAVSDGDKIKAGDMEFQVIALPGHTRCSVGYYCEDEKLLLSSESIGVFNGESGVVPSYLVGYQMALDSIATVELLDIKKILIPHFGVLSDDKADMYLKTAKLSSIKTAEEIISLLKLGKSKDEIMEFFENKFYHGYVKTIYPIDAMRLNTSIMIDLLERECLK